MLLAELFGSFYDVLSRAVSGSVNVSCRPFLSESGGAAGASYYVNHISQGRISVLRVTALEIAAGRAAASVIVDNHRILLGRVEIRRQVETAVNCLPFGVLEVPLPAFSQVHVLEDHSAEIVFEDSCLGLGVVGVKPVGIGSALAVIGYYRRISCQSEAVHEVFFCLYLGYPAVLGIQDVETDVIPVLCCEVNHSVGFAPACRRYIRIEVLCLRGYLA